MLSSKLSNKPRPKAIKKIGYDFSFEAIGTHWQTRIETDLTAETFATLKADILARIETYDHTYSRFRADSWVTSLSKAGGTYLLPEDAQPLLDMYKRLYDVTDGSVTPLVGQLLADAGYDANYSLQTSELQPVLDWSAAIDYDYPTLQIKQPVLLDFGAAGKGYLVDIIAEVCKAAGAQHFSINAGGDIVNYGVSQDLARIGLEHPTELDQMIGIAEVSSGSLCGSAGNRRAWNGFHHIMNPTTRRSTHAVRAAWVVAESGLMADGLSTALFFTDAAKLQQHFTFEYALIGHDMSLEHSPNFPAVFFGDESIA